MSVNPARSFGPAVLAGGEALSQLWLFVVAPAVGAAIVGALLFRFEAAGTRGLIIATAAAVPPPPGWYRAAMVLPAIALVVARARNGVIGTDGDLPWQLRSDLQWFKAITIGKPCIMGRATWESLPLKPLPGRLNIVLSRDPGFRSAKGALVCSNLDEALEIARETAERGRRRRDRVIGGAALFEAALPRAKRIYLTEVEAEPEGDAFMPAFDESALRRRSGARPTSRARRTTTPSSSGCWSGALRLAS